MIFDPKENTKWDDLNKENLADYLESINDLLKAQKVLEASTKLTDAIKRLRGN